MSYYLISIGGTGAKCSEAFVYLNGAGLLKDSQPVKLFFVDADVACGNLVRAQQVANKMNELSDMDFGDSGLFANKIDAADAWTPLEQGSATLDEIFSINSLKNNKESEAGYLLYQILFSKDERTTPLDKGFRGHPAIGTAVIADAAINKHDQTWKNLMQEINNDKDAKVFLFASVFGGTGAAGFPTIARVMFDKLNKDPQGNPVVQIGGALVLPFFQFPAASEQEAKEMQAKVDNFILNTQSALAYYQNSDLLKSVFKKIYLIGDSDLADVKEFSLGSESQKNDANYIELYAALAAFDFFNHDATDEYGVTPMIARGAEENNQDSVEWGDLPDPCIKEKLYDRLVNYISFLHVYKNGVLPILRKCSLGTINRKHVAWFIDLVQNRGKLDVSDKEVMEKFEKLGVYAKSLFSWLGQISSNSKRTINLVNTQEISLDDEVAYKNRHLEELILPIKERKKDYRYVWQQLCSSERQNLKGVKYKKEGFLFNKLYDVVKK